MKELTYVMQIISIKYNIPFQILVIFQNHIFINNLVIDTNKVCSSTIYYCFKIKKNFLYYVDIWKWPEACNSTFFWICKYFQKLICVLYTNWYIICFVKPRILSTYTLLYYCYFSYDHTAKMPLESYSHSSNFIGLTIILYHLIYSVILLLKKKNNINFKKSW